MVRAEAECDDLVGCAGEVFPRERRAVAAKAHAGGGGGEIEPTAIIGHRTVAGEIEPEIAERLVALLVTTEPVFGDVGIGFGIFAGFDEGGDVIEILGEIERAKIGGWLAGGERVFVELEVFAEWTAVNHGGEAAVAERERIGPFLGRLIVPQRKRVAGRGGGDRTYSG